MHLGTVSVNISSQSNDEEWLQRYLLDSIQRKLCTRIGCSTCAAMEFRTGLLQCAGAIRQEFPHALDDLRAAVIVRALARVHPIPGKERETDEAVRLILFDLWTVFGERVTDGDMNARLLGTWAGRVLSRMKEHYEADKQRRRAHDEANDPVLIQQRRAEKKRQKQERHSERLMQKEERDRVWREKRGKAGQ